MLFLFAVTIFILAVAIWIYLQKRLSSLQNQMQQTFKSLSFDVLEQNGRQFMQMADLALQPICEGMKQLEAHQKELEKKREGAYVSIKNQVDALMQSEKELHLETARLVQALRSPQARGNWGEIQLRRVVEMAGLINYCDFFEQKVFESEKKMRPDLIIRLPGNRQVAVDAKSPIAGYLEAQESNDETFRKKKLQEHASVLRKHIKDLSAKEYWKQFDPTPEYVILFLPAEAFFSAALQADPSLIELGADQNIILATPTTLIAILRAIAQGWKQDSLSKSAKEIAKLGEDLYDRIGILIDHWAKVGKSLHQAVESYNQSIASLESRVLVSARKLKECGALNKELPEVHVLENSVRPVENVEA